MLSSKGSSFPARVGRYELLLQLGTGGMARVFLARAEGAGGFERDVALKIVHEHFRDSREAVLELVEEAKLTARVRHLHVVPVLDVGEDPAGVFLVLEYVEGASLSLLAQKGEASEHPLPPAIALRLLSDALCGLHAAHELRGDDNTPLGLVHRDFSPQNILVGVDGVARLTDFGIAKARSRRGFTGTGLIKGKIGYLSPEQARGEPIDRRSDVWSAAVVVWEMLAQQRLYATADEMGTLLRIVSEPPRRLRSVRPELPQALDDVLARAFARDREERWASAEQFRVRLLESYGKVADPPEIAAYVDSVLGAELRERRAHAEEIRRARELPEIPEARVPLSAADPPVSPEARTEPMIGVTSPAQVAPPASSAASRRFAVGAIATVLAVLAAGLAYGVRAQRRAPAEPTAVVFSSAVPALSPELAPSAASSNAPESVSPAAPFLTIVANAPVGEVRIGDRSIPLRVPSQTVSPPLLPEEAARALTITAVSVDGRRASTVATDLSRTVVLSFGDARPASRKGPASPSRPPGKGLPSPLDNPYTGGR